MEPAFALGGLTVGLGQEGALWLALRSSASVQRVHARPVFVRAQVHEILLQLWLASQVLDHLQVRLVRGLVHVDAWIGACECGWVLTAQT